MSDRTAALHGVIAVVTGASSGIGESYARRLAQHGARVVLAARRLERLEALAAELPVSSAGPHEAVQADLSTREGPKRLFEAAVCLGPVQVLVNNAGLGSYAPVIDADFDRQLASIDVNVRALVDASQRFGAHMRDHGRPSYISNVASLASFQTAPGYAVYGGSKAFVRVFSETMAFELADSNIRVSCLCPGGTYTEFMDSAGTRVTRAGERVMMSADEVAVAGIEGMLRGRDLVVPGLLNQVAAFLPRLVPRRLGLSLAGRTLRRSMVLRDE